jgi:hypothetical protein
MLVTLLGKSIDFRLVPEKTSALMVKGVDPSAKDTVRASTSDPHFLKACAPMLVTLAGMLTDPKCAQFRKAELPMLVNLLGMSIYVRLESAKALSPMVKGVDPSAKDTVRAAASYPP